MSTIIGKQLKLTGKTLKGKNRVRTWGAFWIVLAESEKVAFSPHRHWLFVAPIGLDQESNSSRWINAVDDENFTVELA